MKALRVAWTTWKRKGQFIGNLIARVALSLFCFALSNALVLLIVAGFCWTSHPQLAQAQGPTWQNPIKLYETLGWVEDVLLLSDAAGRLHVLWSERDAERSEPGAGSVLYYMVKEGGGWSDPIDIVVRPTTGGMFELDGFSDSYGRVHLVHGSVNQPFVYSRSVYADARSAQDWAPPHVLSEHRQLGGSIALGPAGDLHIAYAATSASIYHRASPDWGRSWSAPQATMPRPPENETAYEVVLESDPQGNLHMTWCRVRLPESYPPIGCFYTRSADAGQSWSEPIQIAPPDQVVAAILAADDGRVHVLYIGRGTVGGRYHCWSADGGLTWARPQQLSAPEEGGGLSGGDLAMDAAGTLHAVFATSSIAHSQWDGRAWSQWRDIVGDASHGALEIMSIEVTHGNRLHAVWESDHQVIWYVEGRSDAPEVPVVDFLPLPTPTPEMAKATPTSTATLMVQSRVPLTTPTQPGPIGANPGLLGISLETTLFLAIVPSFLLVAGVVWWKLATTRRR